MKKKIKLDTRGGARKPKNKRTSQGLLIQALLNEHGGCAEVGRKLGIDRQVPLNWIRRGHVPFDKVGPVSRALGCSFYALNYEAMVTLLGTVFSWEGVVHNAFCKNLPIMNKILSAKHPRNAKDILDTCSYV